MRLISLREFRTRGVKALEAVPYGENVLLSGQDGPAYFLVPVLGDVALQDLELSRANARSSIHESWRSAKTAGTDQTSDHDINHEIDRIRSASPTRS